MYSFLPSSLLNARFRFHLIHPHLIIQCKVFFSSHFILLGGGFVVNIEINDIISKCELVFFSHFRMNMTKMRVHAEADCFWLILLPFSGWLLKILWLVQDKILLT